MAKFTPSRQSATRPLDTGMAAGQLGITAGRSDGPADGVILDLCAGSGNWSRPYADAGYEVVRIDLPADVRLVEHLGRPVRGVLAAPPCTAFSLAGAWVSRTDDEVKLALSVVDACLRAVAVYRPAWWALENPTGRLRKYLGRPALTFHPCAYGDPWTKRTDLWGHFTPPARTPVEPRGSIIDRPGCKASGSRAERAKTPAGFARAFFAANP